MTRYTLHFYSSTRHMPSHIMLQTLVEMLWDIESGHITWRNHKDTRSWYLIFDFLYITIDLSIGLCQILTALNRVAWWKTVL